MLGFLALRFSIPTKRLATGLATLPLLALAACGGPSGQPGTPAEAGVVNVYSSRHYPSDRLIFDAFEKRTGITVNVVDGLQGDQLIERLKAEGSATAADVILTVDAGNLWRLTEQGLLQPVQSETLNKVVPAQLRDPEGRWFGFSKRARVIAYAKDRVDLKTLSSYDDLAGPQFKGRVCARSSTNVYNLSLLAGRIERQGAAAALAWAKGVAGNMARPPQGGDTEQLKAVAAGECDVAIVNHYYFVRLANSADPADKAAAEKLALVFPDQSGVGAHVNVSGGGVAAYAKNRDNAVRLLEEWLSPEAQAIIAENNDEFPVLAGVPLPPALQSLAGFKEDDTPLVAYGQRQAEAQQIYDLAGWR